MYIYCLSCKTFSSSCFRVVWIKKESYRIHTDAQRRGASDDVIVLVHGRFPGHEQQKEEQGGVCGSIYSIRTTHTDTNTYGRVEWQLHRRRRRRRQSWPRRCGGAREVRGMADGPATLYLAGRRRLWREAAARSWQGPPRSSRLSLRSRSG